MTRSQLAALLTILVASAMCAGIVMYVLVRHWLGW
jgi:hypothetical protein